MVVERVPVGLGEGNEEVAGKEEQEGPTVTAIVFS